MRDVISLHPHSAVVDGLTHPLIHRLSPAAADTAAVGRETCALRATFLPPERRRDMLPVPHDSLDARTSGPRVRLHVPHAAR